MEGREKEPLLSTSITISCLYTLRTICYTGIATVSRYRGQRPKDGHDNMTVGIPSLHWLPGWWGKNGGHVDRWKTCGNPKASKSVYITRRFVNNLRRQTFRSSE
ncbi:hypothetical protein PoB_000145600 [Plakobranchus ocellatus]|uniref:Uncharacterized protein n=1 Tax=Plakobranchus ocellatus TaxID=259542 RepID=A0AAV3XY09_9GAST|nr:hypothetical protein PoB_000145600 [Plakobranchus ocellatus]